MRVVHICNLPLPPGHPDHGRIVSHPGRWVLNLALAQRACAGIDARLVVQVPGASADHRAEIEGVPVHFVAAPDRLRSALLFVPDVVRLRRAALAAGPDLVHAHGTEDAYALAAEACGKPHVITAQGCYFLINRELPPKPLSRERVVQFTEWLALRRARHVIAKSRYVRDALAREFPHLELHEIPNTFDPRLLDIPLDGERREGHYAFVGTIVERKGVHVLCRALALMRDRAPDKFSSVHLHVFGDRPGKEAPYEAEQKAALRACLGPRVHFHGTVPALDVARSLAGVAALVAPSLEEMFGNQLIEALLVGADAIVTRGTAMAENAGKLGVGTVVGPGAAGELADAMLARGFALQSAAEKQKIRRRINELMGPDTVARKHRAIYEKILSGA